MTETASLTIKVDSRSTKMATGDLQALEKQAARTEKSALGLGKVFSAALVGTGVALALGAIIRNTIEAEKAQAQLAAVLKSTGGAAGLAQQELNEMAGALQKVTTFDDEAITGAQSLLLTFTRIGRDVFPQATETVLDMSQALGQDLKSSAVQLGKALQDPIEGITALRRVGVNFSDAQQEVIKNLVETGHAADAQRLILQELQIEFGGSARAARDTLGGALEGLKNTFSDLLEGDSGSEGIRGATKGINELTDVMGSAETKAAFASMISGLASIASFAANASAAVINFSADIFKATNDKSRQGKVIALEAIEQQIKQIEDLKSGKFLSAGKRLAGEVKSALLDPFNAAAKAQVLAQATTLDELKKQRDALYKELVLGPPKANELGGKIEWIDPPAPRASDGLAKAAEASGVDQSADATRAAAQASREAAEAAREQESATADFNRRLEDMVAELGGPLAQAMLEHNRRLAELDELQQKGKISSDLLREAKEAETELYAREREEIERRLDPARDMIATLKAELELYGMTNAQRHTAIQLRQLEGRATADQVAQMEELNKAHEQMQRTVEAMDGVRSITKDFFEDISDGSGSAIDSIRDLGDAFVDQLRRMASEALATRLFGEPGSTGAGTQGGGLLGNLFGWLFGGTSSGTSGSSFGVPAQGSGLLPGFADGTDFAPGGMARVGERGPEEVYLPRGSRVVPNHKLGASRSVTVNVNVPRGTDYRTADQIASASGRAAQRALARTS